MGSDLLYAMPSTLSGLARTLDIGGTFDSYNVSGTETEADRLALTGDWQTVGKALAEAVEAFHDDALTPAQVAAERGKA